MKTFIKLLPIAAMVGLVACQSQPAGLKDAYKKYFDMGVAVNQRNVTDSAQIELIKANFSSITAENDMKPISVHPNDSTWTWENADRIANFCRENGIKLRGHCLVWHSQFCNWMFRDSEGNPVSKEVFYERLREHIFTVVNRYKDVVYGWDVVNEAMSDDENAENPYRQSMLYKLCGDEFIAKAFEWAHEADPDALLFYNDYNAAMPHKTQYIYDMVKKMQDAGVPINAIGMQGHYNIYDNPLIENFEAAIEKYSELVDCIHITEFDVRVNKEAGGQLRFDRGGVEITDEIKKQQEERYAAFFDVLRRHSDVVKCVTFWNLSDRDSWLGAANYPLLFDSEYQPKNSYFVVRDFKK